MFFLLAQVTLSLGAEPENESSQRLRIERTSFVHMFGPEELLELDYLSPLDKLAVLVKSLRETEPETVLPDDADVADLFKYNLQIVSSICSHFHPFMPSDFLFCSGCPKEAVFRQLKDLISRYSEGLSKSPIYRYLPKAFRQHSLRRLPRVRFALNLRDIQPPSYYEGLLHLGVKVEAVITVDNLDTSQAQLAFGSRSLILAFASGALVILDTVTRTATICGTAEYNRSWTAPIPRVPLLIPEMRVMANQVDSDVLVWFPDEPTSRVVAPGRLLSLSPNRAGSGFYLVIGNRTNSLRSLFIFSLDPSVAPRVIAKNDLWVDGDVAESEEGPFPIIEGGRRAGRWPEGRLTEYVSVRQIHDEYYDGKLVVYDDTESLLMSAFDEFLDEIPEERNDLLGKIARQLTSTLQDETDDLLDNIKALIAGRPYSFWAIREQVKNLLAT